DLINKGPHSGLCIKYWMKLEEQYPGRALLLRGNHEQMFIDGWQSPGREEGLRKLIRNIKREGLDLGHTAEWLAAKPLKWESEGVLVTHAGIARTAEDPFDEKSPKGVLYNRQTLKPMGKLQIIGHTIVKGNKPVFS